MGSKEKRRATVVPMIEIELDRKRLLDFDLNALAAAEKAMTEFWGTRTTMGGVLTEGTIGAADTRAMIWGGLIHEDPELTLEQVGAMVHIDNLLYAQGKLMESLTAQGIVKPAAVPGGDSTPPNPLGK